MRKGTLVEQVVQKTRGDGSRSKLGPYTLYTFKRDGKTLSRRLGGGEQVALYRAQIAEFRRFQELTAELAGVGQALADLEAAGEQVDSKKTPGVDRGRKARRDGPPDRAGGQGGRLGP
jgi:hypothetical protein